MTAKKHYPGLKERAMIAAARSFLEQGFSRTTLRGLAKDLGVTTGAIVNLFATKEELLCELVELAMGTQFATAERLVAGKTDDPMLMYACETTLQLYMAESHEYIRELYAAAYSLPKPSSVIQHAITAKLERIFAEHLPGLETKDFYKLEIASGGIMRGFMTIPCDMWFTMDQKVASFLETTFLVYRVPDEKIREAVEFVGQFDFPRIAQATIDSMLTFLDKNTIA